MVSYMVSRGFGEDSDGRQIAPVFNKTPRHFVLQNVGGSFNSIYLYFILCCKSHSSADADSVGYQRQSRFILQTQKE
jgi:hypothetical protein